MQTCRLHSGNTGSVVCKRLCCQSKTAKPRKLCDENKVEIKGFLCCAGLGKKNSTIASSPQPHQTVNDGASDMNKGSYSFNKLHRRKWAIRTGWVNFAWHFEEPPPRCGATTQLQEKMCYKGCGNHYKSAHTAVSLSVLKCDRIENVLRVWDFVPCSSSTNEVVNISRATPCVQHSQLLSLWLFIKPCWMQTVCPTFRKMPLKVFLERFFQSQSYNILQGYPYFLFGWNNLTTPMQIEIYLASL